MSMAHRFAAAKAFAAIIEAAPRGPYRAGRNGWDIVTDAPVTRRGKIDPDEIAYYGGYLIAESIPENAGPLLTFASANATKIALGLTMLAMFEAHDARLVSVVREWVARNGEEWEDNDEPAFRDLLDEMRVAALNATSLPEGHG